MNPWLRTTLFGIFGASLMAGGLAACSGGPAHRGAEAAGHMADMHDRLVERATRRLDLDAAQQRKLRTLADALQAQRAALAGPGGGPRAQARALVVGERFDRAAAQALLDEKTHAVQAHAPEVLAAMADFYDALRPEQQQQVRALLEERRHGWPRRG